MQESFIAIEGIERFADADGNLPENVQMALVRAINRTVDRTRTRAARAVLEQVAFPASYLSPSNKRLFVSVRAKKASLQAVIEGRDSPTMLARFAKGAKVTTGNQRPKNNSVSVRVAAGGAYRAIPRAFLIRLKNNNIGLAVRTDGSAPRGAYKPREIGKNLFLLYGPSVDQALQSARTGNGVYEEISPDALDFLTNEFYRQMDVLEGKNG